MVVNKNTQNQLGENNNGKRFEDIRNRLSILFSGIDFSLITGEELINLGEETVKNGELIIDARLIVQLSEQIKVEIERVIIGNITRNIQLNKKGKNSKSIILKEGNNELKEGNNELKEVPIILEKLINCLWIVNIDDSGYIGTQIKKVGERLIEIGKNLQLKEQK